MQGTNLSLILSFKIVCSVDDEGACSHDRHMTIENNPCRMVSFNALGGHNPKALFSAIW
jgi:hypothetical protein